MLANERFNLRMQPERKEQLTLLAQREGRSLASMIDRLILEKYEEVAKPQPQPVTDPRPIVQEPAVG